MPWISAVLDRVYPDPLGQNFNVYADCTLTDDQGNTQVAKTWANDLDAEKIAAWLHNVVTVANTRDEKLAALTTIVGQNIAPAPFPAIPLATPAMPTIQSVVQMGSVMQAYAALIAANVVSDTDPGYLQALADATKAAADHADVVCTAVSNDTLAAPAPALKAV